MQMKLKRGLMSTKLQIILHRSKSKCTGQNTRLIGRDVLHVLTFEDFVRHSAAEFLFERKSIFWRPQK